MLFQSPIFLFLFLPLVLLGYFVFFRRFQNIFLLIASLFFYAWGEGGYVLLLLFTITINYFFALLIQRKKVWIYPVVILDVLILGYYKYTGFILANLYRPLTLLKFHPPAGLDIHLPLGISFITFHVISYCLDVRNKRVKAEKRFLNFALYVSLFPHLIAGPIVKYREIQDFIRRRKDSWELFSQGVIRFVGGLAKKVILADNLARVSDHIFSLQPFYITAETLWLALIFYALQIFFDFSGYTDMAIGLANMFGFQFPENFNYPYMATSISDFWRRWHMTLTSWFREYVYIPLGGNRRGFLRVAFNLMLVFLLTGFWHGSNWHFIVWGGYFGLFLVLEKTFVGRFMESIWKPLRHFYTLLVVTLGWLFFRVDNLGYSLYLLRVLLGKTGNSTHAFSLSYFLSPFLILVFLTALIFSTPYPSKLGIGVFRGAFLGAALLLALSEIAGSTFIPFIYFRF